MSTYKLEKGPEHPLKPLFKDLIREQPQMESIHRHIYESAVRKTPTVFNFAEVVANLKSNGMYSQLRAIAAKMKDGVADFEGLKSKMVLKPPPSDELYLRVKAGEDISDIGTGDGRRLVRYQGFFGKVRCFDKKKITPVKDFPKKWTIEVLGEHRLDGLVFSFLAWGQFTPLLRMKLESYDGLHLAPLQSRFRQLGYVEDVDDHMITTVGSSQFVEYPHESKGGQDFGFYEGFNTYALKEYELEPEFKSTEEEELARGSYVRLRHPVVATPTYKEDGVLLNLKCDGNNFKLFDRLGRAFYGRSKGLICTLILEKVADEFVLLRVIRYTNFRPFHSYDMLRLFTSRVKIKIMGLPVRPPILVEQGVERPLTDGYVYRMGDVDYVVNYGISLDLYHDSREKLDDFLLRERSLIDLEHKGYKHSENMFSVMIREQPKGGCVIYWKERFDKKQPDPVDSWRDKFRLLTVDRLLIDDFHVTGQFEYDGEGESDEEV